MITIDGHIQHVTYRNEDNHYVVAKFNAEKTRSTITVVGYIATT